MSTQLYPLSPLQLAVARAGRAGDLEALLEIRADGASVLHSLRDLASVHELFRARIGVVPGRGDPCTEIDDDFDPASSIVGVAMPAEWAGTLDAARALIGEQPAGRARMAVIAPAEGDCVVYVVVPRLLCDAGGVAAFARLLEERLAGDDVDAGLQYTDVAQALTDLSTAQLPCEPPAGGGAVSRLEIDVAALDAALRDRARAFEVEPGALALALWTSFVARSGVACAEDLGWMADGHRDRELAKVLGPLDWPSRWAPAQPPDMKLRALAALAHGFIASETLDVDAFSADVAAAPLHWIETGAVVTIRDLDDPGVRARIGLRWISNAQSARAWLIFDDGVSPQSARLIASALRSWIGSALRSDAERLDGIEWRVPELLAWYRGAADVPRVVEETIPARLADLAARFADHAALVDGTRTLTYSELHRRVLRQASALALLGVQRGDLVAIACDRGADLYLLMLATLCSGATFLPLDLAQPRARNEAILRDSRARLIVASDRQRLAGYSPDAMCMAVADLETIEWREADLPAIEARDAAYAIYTSGTTGTPKGVLVSHASLIAYADHVTSRIESPAQERFASLASFATDLSYTAVFGALLTGRTFCVMPDSVTLDGAAFARQLRDSAVDCLKIVPGHWLALCEQAVAAGVDPPVPRRAIVFGGERLTRAVIDRVVSAAPGVGVFNHYGPTETTVGVAAGPVARDAEGHVALGTPLPHARAYVLGDRGELCLPGVQGELAFAGACVARCYHGQPALTANRFRPDPQADVPGERLYLTGDQGHIDGHRRLHFCGRRDDQVKIGGQRIEPGEIVAALRAIEGVAGAEVVADLRGAEPVLRAFVKLARPRTIDDLQRELRAAVPEALMPATIHEVVSMPLAGNGKVDRAALLALSQTRSALLEPRTATEVSLRTLWAELLAVEAHLIGVESNFFRLGGHSLMAARMLARVRLLFGREVGVGRFFTAPTIAGLAASIAEAPATRETGLQGSGDPARHAYPLSAGQKRLWATAQLGAAHAYNNAYCTRISGELDAAKLVRCIGIIARRHHVLHARIAFDDREATMRLMPDEPVSLQLVDLSDIPASRGEAISQEIVAAASRWPFELDREPPLRVAILRLGPRSWLLVLVVHHVAWDGASGGIFLRELAHLYRADDPQRALPKLAVNFGDFALAEQRWFDSAEYERGVSRWLSRLAGLPMLELRGVDYGAARGERHGEVAVTLPADVARSLGALARRQSATAFMVALTIYFLALHRHSGQTDIAVGTSVENRGDRRLEGLIGFFVNQLVLRADLSGDPTVEEFIGRVRWTCAEAFDDQSIPFSALVSRVGQPRRPGRSPLYQTMFVFQGAPLPLALADDLTLEPLPPSDPHARFDLSLYLHEQPGGAFDGALVYDRDLLGERLAKAIAADYQRLAALVAAKPEVTISALLGELDTAMDREITDRKFAGLRRRNGVTQ